MIETTSNTVRATPVPPESYALWGILYGGRAPRTESFNKTVPELRHLIEASRLVGHEEASVEAHCAQWPWHAREMYMGDFNVTTLHPILVASNTRDPQTPLRSALNLSTTFEGSGFLEVNGTGVSGRDDKLVLSGC